MLKTKSDLLAEALFGFTIDTIRVEAQLKRKVVSRLLILEQKLVSLVQTVEPTSGLTSAFRTQDMQQIDATAQYLIDDTYNNIQDDLLQDLTRYQTIETLFLQRTIKKIVDEDILLPLTLSAASAVIIGATLEQWLQRQSYQLHNNLTDNVRLGIVQNLSSADLVDRIRGIANGSIQVSVDNTKRTLTSYTNSIFDNTNNQAETLVQTALQTVATQTQQEIFAANATLIQGLAAQVTLDNKTSFLCMGRAGFAWKFDGKPLNAITNINFPGYPPWHWNCRTIIVPILYGDPVPQTLSYDEWLQQQSQTVQQQILGPARYQLWAQKKISLTDLTTKVGTTLTIKQLNQKYNK
jgi:hypothetical protein